MAGEFGDTQQTKRPYVQVQEGTNPYRWFYDGRRGALTHTQGKYTPSWNAGVDELPVFSLTQSHVQVQDFPAQFLHIDSVLSPTLPDDIPLDRSFLLATTLDCPTLRSATARLEPDGDRSGSLVSHPVYGLANASGYIQLSHNRWVSGHCVKKLTVDLEGLQGHNLLPTHDQSVELRGANYAEDPAEVIRLWLDSSGKAMASGEKPAQSLCEALKQHVQSFVSNQDPDSGKSAPGVHFATCDDEHCVADYYRCTSHLPETLASFDPNHIVTDLSKPQIMRIIDTHIVLDDVPESALTRLSPVFLSNDHWSSGLWAAVLEDDQWSTDHVELVYRPGVLPRFVWQLPVIKTADLVRANWFSYSISVRTFAYKAVDASLTAFPTLDLMLGSEKPVGDTVDGERLYVTDSTFSVYNFFDPSIIRPKPPRINY